MDEGSSKKSLNSEKKDTPDFGKKNSLINEKKDTPISEMKDSPDIEKKVKTLPK